MKFTTIVALTCALLALPASASAAVTLVEPVDGHHYDHLDLAPLVTFDPGVDLQPKWVLLATDREMTKTVRYCRQFFWAPVASQTGLKWGCNRWATGADGAGNDTLQALEPGVAYYWKVVSKASPTDATEVSSDVRSFFIDAAPVQPTIEQITDKITGTVFDDGTQLNLGAAAFVNSKVRVKSIKSSRIATYAFRIKVGYEGSVDSDKSYIAVKSAAGTRYVKVKRIQGGVQAVWTLNAAERKLKTKRFTYQSFLKATANGSKVRSAPRVLVIKSAKPAASTTPTTPVPIWTPD